MAEALITALDPLIRRYDVTPDRDLNLCSAHGVAYQRDMQVTARYEQAYFDKCRSYEDQEIANAINAGRIALVNKYVGNANVLDVGVGSGEFVRKRPRTYGFDVNPAAVQWLRERRCFDDKFENYEAVTFWDVLEHMQNPGSALQRLRDNSYLFACLPIFENLARIRDSKHYRPGEHLYYWTQQGFVDYLAEHRYRFLEVLDFETQAGRDSIMSFAFQRNLPSYQDTIEQYRVMHRRAYGVSAMLYFDHVRNEVLPLNPRSILDYGCGRSELSAYFWNDGKRRIVRYDPAIVEFSEMPQGQFDLVLVMDVMEHIPMSHVDHVLREVRQKSGNALFTISLRPAKAKLPDGRNAHVTLLSVEEWLRWIREVFGKKLRRIATRWDHILMVKTF